MHDLCSVHTYQCSMFVKKTTNGRSHLQFHDMDAQDMMASFLMLYTEWLQPPPQRKRHYLQNLRLYQQSKEK